MGDTAEAERLIVEAAAENATAAQVWATTSPRVRKQYLEWVAASDGDEELRSRIDTTVRRAAAGELPAARGRTYPGELLFDFLDPTNWLF